MIIATWNVNSIAVRLPHITAWLEKHQPAALCLQETKCTDDKFPAQEINAVGYKSVFIGERSYNGVAILTRQDAADVQRNFPGDDDSAPKRLIAATVEGVRVINVYVPNGTELGSDKFEFKLDWLQRLRNYLEETSAKDQKVLLCGDFNVAPDERDVYDVRTWEGKLHFSKPERRALDYVRRWGFEDAFRLQTPEGGHYSWWNYREGAFPKDNGLRIDHIYISRPLAAQLLRCWIDREPRAWERPSDHTPVVAEFAD